MLGLPEVEKPASLKGRGGLWVRVGDRDVHIGTEDGFDRFEARDPFGNRIEFIQKVHLRQSMRRGEGE